MTPDSPEIARLRGALLTQDTYTEAVTADLRYALALIDESCKSCAMVDELRKQGARLDRMYALFDEVMREHRGDGRAPVGTTNRSVVELRTCQYERCFRDGGEANG